MYNEMKTLPEFAEWIEESFLVMPREWVYGLVAMIHPEWIEKINSDVLVVLQSWQLRRKPRNWRFLKRFRFPNIFTTLSRSTSSRLL